MSSSITLNANARSDFGKGASRRLRREELVPAIIYGAGADPAAVTLKHNEILKVMNNEAVYSAILDLVVDGKKEKVVLRDVQRHPYKTIVMHMDFMRVRADQELNVHVPLHFIGEEECIGVKEGGGSISRIDVEVDLICLPADLPEFIEVDVSGLALGDSLHLSDLVLPEGVRSVVLAHGEDHDRAVVSVHATRGGSEDSEDDVEAAPEEGSAE